MTATELVIIRYILLSAVDMQTNQYKTFELEMGN